jgi:hypothetical protein
MTPDGEQTQSRGSAPGNEFGGSGLEKGKFFALAYRVDDMVERAYHRGDALDKRRDLMEAWASFLTETGKVVRFALR